ncbi:hypothetical protein [Qipengyuania sp. ASV99]
MTTPSQRANDTDGQPRKRDLASGLFGQRLSRNLGEHNDNGELAAA